MKRLTGVIAGAALTFGVGAVSAGETPEILGAVNFQVMSTGAMASVTGQAGGHHRNRHRGRISIVNRNNNTNVNQQQQAQCLALCAGGNLPIASPLL